MFLLILQDGPLLKAWFKQDDTFNLPKACILFEITRYLLLNKNFALDFMGISVKAEAKKFQKLRKRFD